MAAAEDQEAEAELEEAEAEATELIDAVLTGIAVGFTVVSGTLV